MKIKLNKHVLQNFPGLSYTVLVLKNTHNSKRSSVLMQLLRGICAVKKNELKKPEYKEKFQQTIAETLKEDSILLESYLLQSRIKKITNGKELSTEDNLSDCLMYLSLKFLVPVFAFDLDQREKDYCIDFFVPKKGRKPPEPDLNKETKHLAFWIANLGTSDQEQFEYMLHEFQTIFTKYCGGDITDVFILNHESPEADLNYVSQKEIEYNEKMEAEAKARAEAEEKIQSAELEHLPQNLEPSIDIKQNLSLLLSEALTKLKVTQAELFPEDFQVQHAEIELEVPKDPSHGDYSTNIALKLAKKLGKNPLELAEKIKENIAVDDNVKSIEVKAPGFINFSLSLDYLVREFQKIHLLKEHYGELNLGQGEKVMIEFGSLNIAKPFGAHHFLTTVLGQTLVNLHKVAGFKVLAADYPGDWGTQFGKLIYAYKSWGSKEVIDKDPMGEFLKLYIKFHEEAEKDPSLEDKARQEFKKMEEKDPENLKIWSEIREISLKDIETIYKTMGVHHDRSYPESKYIDACQEILQEGKSTGIFVQGEQGAYIVDLEAENLPPYLVQKSDGTTLYSTRDLASLKDRTATEKDLKKIVYVVDVAQSLHFKQLFTAAKKFGFTDIELVHVPYGRMRLPEASMSTRKGNIILAKDLIQEAVSRLTTIVKEKSGELPENEQKMVVQGLALGAIKYAMICQNPESDFTFDWDKVLSFDGNSGPYLQYTQARANSILRKYDETKSEKIAKNDDQVSLFSIEQDRQAQEEEAMIPFDSPHEKDLLKRLIKFAEAVENATKNYKPNILTSYLFDLAQSFNAFYHAVPVLKTQKPELLKSRLDLVSATAQVLKNGLNIIGMSTFERM